MFYMYSSFLYLQCNCLLLIIMLAILMNAIISSDVGDADDGLIDKQ